MSRTSGATRSRWRAARSNAWPAWRWPCTWSGVCGARPSGATKRGGGSAALRLPPRISACALAMSPGVMRDGCASVGTSAVPSRPLRSAAPASTPGSAPVPRFGTSVSRAPTPGSTISDRV
ncbi:hypothetical protein M0638_19710 [Roseomonas sp. NAR14]|uniref:Uncharacterized protein n=1 Tax=Roseomonas acroporae TaxID=2937791 RepID=A0A9X1YAL2_9PROT|nr:hypothetical protein [Roseomonas acroporae]MCK8786606.1 hypothetical protein [Roseomonas acroporae]